MLPVNVIVNVTVKGQPHATNENGPCAFTVTFLWQHFSSGSQLRGSQKYTYPTINIYPLNSRGYIPSLVSFEKKFYL